jgi:hypothetical protein
MVDQRNNLAKQVEAEVRSHFGDKVYRTRIPRNIRLSEAPSHGQPILLYDIHSKGAVAYTKLAEELLTQLSQLDSTRPSTPPFPDPPSSLPSPVPATPEHKPDHIGDLDGPTS